jgi:molybdopterin-binding protein
VAQFVGVDNILEGKIVAKDGELASIEVDGNMLEAISSSPIGETVSIFFRAEDVAISLLPLRTSMRNIFKGKITKVTTVGSFCHVLIDCGFPLMSLITAHSAEEMALETGKEVYALVKATSIHAVTKNSS